MTYKMGNKAWNEGRKATAKEKARLRRIGFKKGHQPYRGGGTERLEIKGQGFWWSLWEVLSHS